MSEWHKCVDADVVDKDDNTLDPDDWLYGWCKRCGTFVNKQTKESLCGDLKSHGFRMYCLNVWGKGKWSWKIWLYAQSVRVQTFLWKVGKLRAWVRRVGKV